MPELKMAVSLSGPDFSLSPGDLHTFEDEAEASRLIRAGFAEATDGFEPIALEHEGEGEDQDEAAKAAADAEAKAKADAEAAAAEAEAKAKAEAEAAAAKPAAAKPAAGNAKG